MGKWSQSPVLRELRGLSPAYVILFVMSFTSPIMYLATPVFIEQVYDRVMGSRNVTTLYVLAVICLFVMAMHSVMDHVRTKTLRRVGVAIDQRLSRSVFDAVYRQRSGLKPPSGQPLQDLNYVRDFLTGPLVGAFFDAFWSPLFVVAMFIVHPLYGALALGLMVVSGFLAWLNRAITQADSARHQTSAIKAMDFSAALVKSSDAALVMGMIPALRDRWYRMHQSELGWQLSATRRADYIIGAIRFFRLSQFVLITTVGTLLFLNGDIGQIAIMIGFTIMTRALGPIDNVITSWQSFATFRAALARVDELLRVAAQGAARVPLPAPSGALALSRVSAAAPSGKVVLNDISFGVSPGRVLGIVGPSGAGKSCLARVLVGIWRPIRGSVVLGEHDIAHWNQDQLGPHIGYVPQEIDLLPGTLAENIARFGPADAPDYPDKLAAAVELTDIQDIVRSLPDGFDTIVGPGGHVLSGGQKQRVGLARAVYGEPRLVVLDEPNSNLDTFGETALATACERLKASGATIVLVTHKLNMLSVCDDILVLNAGAVQGFGAREQIMSRLPRLKPVPSLTVIEGNAESRRA